MTIAILWLKRHFLKLVNFWKIIVLNLIETFKTISSLFKDFVLNQDPMGDAFCVGSWFIFIFHWIIKITTSFLLKTYSEESRENTFNMLPRFVYKIMKYRNGNNDLITLFVCSVISMSMLIMGSICFKVVIFLCIYLHSLYLYFGKTICFPKITNYLALTNLAVSDAIGYQTN